MAVEVHRHEAGKLQETRIDPAHETEIGKRDRDDHVLLEPVERLLMGQIVRLFRVLGGVDGRAHQGHRGGAGRVVVLGHHRGGGEHRDARLADRHDRDPLTLGAEELTEFNEIVDVVVEVEPPFRQRHVAGVDPVGDVDVMFRQHRLDRAAEQGGEMAGHRRDDQNLGIAAPFRRIGVAAEMQQVAKGFLQHHLLDDGDVATLHLDRLDPELRLAVAAGGVDEHLAGGGHRAGADGGSVGIHWISQRLMAYLRHSAQRRDGCVRDLIRVVKHVGPPLVRCRARLFAC
jgi:hypothetical protein